VVSCYRDCDALLLECNHDAQMLANGSYPRHLKQRVGGALGHLSNRQASQMLAHMDLERLQHVVVAHVSEHNNCLTLVHETLQGVLQKASDCIRVADQELGLEWIPIR